MKIGIILTSDIRSKAYLQKCIKNNLHFDRANTEKGYKLRLQWIPIKGNTFSVLK